LLFAGGIILALLAGYFIIKFLISFTKKTAEKASSAARAGVSKSSEDADNFKEKLSNKAEDLSSQAKAKASALTTDFNKEGGLKDQFKSMSQKTLDTVSRAGSDLKQEAENINNIRLATLQNKDTATTKSDLLKSFWSQLNKKQKLLIISASLILGFAFSNLSGTSNFSNSENAATFRDPKVVANNIGITGVARCIAAVTMMSAGFVNDSKIRPDGPEIRNNNDLGSFYGDARMHLINSMNNPAVEGAIDNSIRQQGQYFGNIIRFQGWDTFLPVYKDCKLSAYN
jgi:UPF0716 family protein affecting phage T7 exclusion